MSLLLSRHRLGKPLLVRSSLLLLSKSFSSSSTQPQTPPCWTLGVGAYADLRTLTINNYHDAETIDLAKKGPLDVACNDRAVTIGASHGWVATLKEDRILRLQDDLNPVVSDRDPKRIPLPPLVTLPHCQTQIVTNVSMSSSSPEDEDCVVAVKFLGPQLSFCRPAQSNSEWINIRIENTCFYSSRVMFFKKDGMFHIPGSGGHLIGSWDLGEHKDRPKIQRLKFRNLPKLTKSKMEIMESCCTSEHLAESRSTGETFLVKRYKKTEEMVDGIAQMKTEALMVFKLDGEGNAVYTEDIGGQSLFISKSDPFFVDATSFPGLYPNFVYIVDFDGKASVSLPGSLPIVSSTMRIPAPYQIPPQNIV